MPSIVTDWHAKEARLRKKLLKARSELARQERIVVETLEELAAVQAQASKGQG